MDTRLILEIVLLVGVGVDIILGLVNWSKCDDLENYVVDTANDFQFDIDNLRVDVDNLWAYSRHERKGKRKRKNQNRKVLRTDVEYEDVLPEDDEDELLREF